MKVVLSPEAADRLESQIAYLRDVGAGAAAERLRTRIMTFLSKHIAHFPRTGRWLDDRDLWEMWIPRTRIVLWYRIREGAHRDCDRLAHGAEPIGCEEMKKRVGILISGRGSNMAALIEAARAPDYPAEIVLVISNRPDAAGLERARAAGIEAVVIDHKGFASREAFDGAVEEALLGHGVDLVCHAGFMRIQSEAFAARWTGRQLNIHPSLLPSFRGLKPQQQALDAGVRISGCTVHFVTPELDAGPIVAQAAVPVLAGETADTLAERILTAEHRLYPLALRLVAGGEANLQDGKVVLQAAINPLVRLLSPPESGSLLDCHTGCEKTARLDPPIWTGQSGRCYQSR